MSSSVIHFTADAPSFQPVHASFASQSPDSTSSVSHSASTSGSRSSSRKRHQRNSGVDPGNSKPELYKTELCRAFAETGLCRYGSKCQFAHGQAELRPVARHPLYKTEYCRMYHTLGTCCYGSRCRFIHESPDEAENPLRLSPSHPRSRKSQPLPLPPLQAPDGPPKRHSIQAFVEPAAFTPTEQGDPTDPFEDVLAFESQNATPAVEEDQMYEMGDVPGVTRAVIDDVLLPLPETPEGLSPITPSSGTTSSTSTTSTSTSSTVAQKPPLVDNPGSSSLVQFLDQDYSQYGGSLLTFW